MLSRLSDEPWIVTKANHYKDVFINTVNSLLKILYTEKKYAQVLRIAEEALQINDIVPSFHYYIVLAYLGQGKKIIARSYAQKSQQIFSKETYQEILDKL